jgi:hypothetical protein
MLRDGHGHRQVREITKTSCRIRKASTGYAQRPVLDDLQIDHGNMREVMRIPEEELKENSSLPPAFFGDGVTDLELP